MFVSREAAGMGEILLREASVVMETKSGLALLDELQNIKITSNTGLTERRELIRNWTAEELVRAYTILRTRILMQGNISRIEKVLIEAMEKEGIEQGGRHTGVIIGEKPQRISHGQGLTITNNRHEIEAGWTNLSVWTLLNSKQ